MSYVIGVDAGGSKTLCVVASSEGEVLAVGRAGTGNWQGPGIEKARREVASSIEDALGAAGIDSSRVAAAYFGMAGADRPSDFARVRELLAPLITWPTWGLENDATIALRAQVTSGPGIGVICGSGTNVVGFNDREEKVQVGGFGFPFGDGAGATHIGIMAMRHAWRALDGRGPFTPLADAIVVRLELDRLEDSIELHYADRIDWGGLAPLVFQEAEAGDAVSRAILTEVGEELALAASAAWKRLFDRDDLVVPVVGGGSVFQRPSYSLLLDTFEVRLLDRHPAAEVLKLSVPPVLGAVHGALELQAGPLAQPVVDRLRREMLRIESQEVAVR